MAPIKSRATGYIGSRFVGIPAAMGQRPAAPAPYNPGVPGGGFASGINPPGRLPVPGSYNQWEQAIPAQNQWGQAIPTPGPVQGLGPGQIIDNFGGGAAGAYHPPTPGFMPAMPGYGPPVLKPGFGGVGGLVPGGGTAYQPGPVGLGGPGMVGAGAIGGVPQAGPVLGQPMTLANFYQAARMKGRKR